MWIMMQLTAEHLLHNWQTDEEGDTILQVIVGDVTGYLWSVDVAPNTPTRMIWIRMTETDHPDDDGTFGVQVTPNALIITSAPIIGNGDA